MTANAASTSRGKQVSTIFQEAETFSSFSVNDVKRAKEFYGKTLGLEIFETAEGLELDTRGGKIFLYAKPNHTPASFTVLNFAVKDIERAVDELEAVGVKPEHYDLPDIKTDKRGIFRGDPGPKIAWFKDPAGNILSVLQSR
jgi:catechol 2,3-dioxygenase-like lactoylglutathione lyase family enzyme